jgi:hypothetical protein
MFDLPHIEEWHRSASLPSREDGWGLRGGEDSGKSDHSVSKEPIEKMSMVSVPVGGRLHTRDIQGPAYLYIMMRDPALLNVGSNLYFFTPFR